jgi:hypothetical protein
MKDEFVKIKKPKSFNKIEENDFVYMSMSKGSKLMDELKEAIQNGYLIPLDNDIRHKFLSQIMLGKHMDLVYNWRE